MVNVDEEEEKEEEVIVVSDGEVDDIIEVWSKSDEEEQSKIVIKSPCLCLRPV